MSDNNKISDFVILRCPACLSKNHDLRKVSRLRAYCPTCNLDITKEESTVSVNMATKDGGNVRLDTFEATEMLIKKD